MTGEDKTPECTLGEHKMCRGPQEIRLPGAPAWQVPVLTVRCGCACHRRRPGR